MEGMKIKILESHYIFKNDVGNEYLVENYDIDSNNLRFNIIHNDWVRVQDCVITELPNKFCVKNCEGIDKDKWVKYIWWLNKTYNSKNTGHLFSYYGVIDNKSVILGDPFETEIHIDDMIKHIDYMESQQQIKGGEQFYKESQSIITMKKILPKEDILEYARRNYPIGTKYRTLDCNGCSRPVEYISEFEPKYWNLGEDMIEVGDGLIYHKGKWAEIIDEVKLENSLVNVFEENDLFNMDTNEGRLAYAKKYYTIGTIIQSFNGNTCEISDIPKFWGKNQIDVNCKGDRQPFIFHSDYGWAKIIKEEKKMETQKLSRKGLKEIHAVACSSWKSSLELLGANNPLEDYIELNQDQIDAMFKACTSSQLPIVSKYLKQDDGSVDVTKFTLSGKGFCDDNFLYYTR